MKKILISGACSTLASNFIRNVLYEGSEYKLSGFDKIVKDTAFNNIYVNKDFSFHIADMNDSHIFNRIVQYEKPDIIIDFSNSIKTKDLEKTLSEVDRYILVSNYYNNNKIEKESFELQNMNILKLPRLFGPRQFPNDPIAQMFKSFIMKQKVNIDMNPVQDEFWMHIFDAIKNLKQVISTPKDVTFAYGTQCFNLLDIQQRVVKLVGSDIDVSYSNNLNIIDYILKSDTCFQNFAMSKGLDQVFEWYTNNNWSLK